MVKLWKIYCLSLLEQSCDVWDSGLTQENKIDLERTQKTFCKMILEENYLAYPQALKTLRHQSLEQRRKMLTLRFAKRSLSDGKHRDLFPQRKKNMTLQQD